MTVMISDKFIYLFDRIIPALSLTLSGTLRFVTEYTNRLLAVAGVQWRLCRDVFKRAVLQRKETSITILSILITWVLKNAIKMADSAKSCGYGLLRRMAFSIYCLDSRDMMLLL